MHNYLNTEPVSIRDNRSTVVVPTVFLKFDGNLSLSLGSTTAKHGVNGDINLEHAKCT